MGVFMHYEYNELNQTSAKNNTATYEFMRKYVYIK